MSMPTPWDMARAPAWDNYVVAQAVQATLGIIPRNAVGIYVVISETSVELRFQLSELAEGDVNDMADIIDNFTMLLGFIVPVSSAYRIVERCEPTLPGVRVRWIFSKRMD